MNKYDWSNVPKEVRFIATDIQTNTAQGHEKTPVAGFDTWRSSSRIWWLHLEGFKGNWLDSLEERPNE